MSSYLPWRRILTAMVLQILLGAMAPASALEVAIALSQPGGPYAQFQDRLQSLTRSSAHRLTLAGNSQDGFDEGELQRADLVVTVGAQATADALTRFRRPVLAVLVSRGQAEGFLLRHPEAEFSAVVLDQPPTRHMRLAAAVVPGLSRVGMLLGPDSSAVVEREFTSAADANGLALAVRRVDSPSGLLLRLEQLLEVSDALLVIPDAVVATQSSARTILLTSYRYRRPILAYSRAYVDAGALAAVFASPEDAAGDVAEWLDTRAAGKVRQQPIQSPKRCSVAVNRQVARALGIDVPGDETLLQRITEVRP